MANQAKSLSAGRQNFSKAQIAARQQAEELVVTNQTTPKQNTVVKSNPQMKKLFNQLKKYNEHFTEADSIALNSLTFNLFLKVTNEQKLSEFDTEDEQYERFLLRLEKINKQINESMKQLCIPLSNRLSLANDMAKVMIEEKKLEQMNTNTAQEVNPLLAVLREIGDMN